jgi:hypothetical protein
LDAVDTLHLGLAYICQADSWMREATGAFFLCVLFRFANLILVVVCQQISISLDFHCVEGNYCKQERVANASSSKKPFSGSKQTVFWIFFGVFFHYT